MASGYEPDSLIEQKPAQAHTVILSADDQFPHIRLVGCDGVIGAGKTALFVPDQDGTVVLCTWCFVLC
jgi:hypothetical protein